MAKKLDRTGEKDLLRITGRRLVAARTAACFKNADVSEKLGYHGKTQLSLAETGNRFLPPPTLLKVADMYGVSIDYLYGRVEDPLADPAELNQGVLVSAIASNVRGLFDRFARTVGTDVAAMAQTRRSDYEELAKLAAVVDEVKAAFESFVDANPEFEDMAKGSPLQARINRAADLAKRVQGRHANDRDQRDKRFAMIDAELCLIEDEGEVGQQMQLAGAWSKART